MMKRLICIILITMFSAPIGAKLLDKIAGVINDKIFTLSEIKRIKKSLLVRREIAPFIYSKSSYTNKDILTLLQNSYIVKDKLQEMGFVISDDSVEDRIKETERGLNLNREELLNFLNSKGLSFDEYFEILREAMEFNVFNRRIIAPLVTITDQELKTEYYKNSKSTVLAYTYEVVDYSINSSKLQNSDITRLQKVLTNYRTSGQLPEIFKDIEMTDLGKVSSEELPKNIKKVLKSTNQKSFSGPVKIDNQIHHFYVVKKELAESPGFLKAKNAIYSRLFLKSSSKIINNWFSRESLSYYILDNL